MMDLFGIVLVLTGLSSPEPQFFPQHASPISRNKFRYNR